MISIRKIAVFVVTLSLMAVSFAYVFAGEMQSGSHGVGLLDIEKIGPESAYRGEKIKYTITVNNTADVKLVDVVVEDEMLGFSWQGDLNVGESNVFNLTYTVPCDTEGNLTNTVVAWAQLNETIIDAEASWTTEILYLCVPHSMGYWKNHPEDWPTDEIEIGNITHTKEEALQILVRANAKDATRMLAAQLIAAKLNRLSGCSPCFDYCNETIDIDETIDEADSFLEGYLLGSDPRGEARQEALHIKDLLDAYNNSGCNRALLVPEFPTSTSILLLFIILTVATALYKRRMPKTPIH